METSILTRKSGSIGIPSHATQSDISVIFANEFCRLLQAIQTYYERNPLTTIPARMEIGIEMENLDVRLKVDCYQEGPCASSS